MTKKGKSPPKNPTEVRQALLAEMGRERPNVGVVIRRLGQLNRAEMRERTERILQLVGKPDAAKKASEILGNNS